MDISGLHQAICLSAQKPASVVLSSALAYTVRMDAQVQASALVCVCRAFQGAIRDVQQRWILTLMQWEDSVSEFLAFFTIHTHLNT